MLNLRTCLASAFLLVWSASAATPARAVCTAADVIAAAAGCPNSAAPCVIDANIAVDQPACTFDFGTRNVVVARTISVGSRVLNIFAGDLSIVTAGSGTGFIDARGTAANGPDSRGGSVIIRITGQFNASGGARALLVSGAGASGNITIDAGDDVSIAGQVRADGTSINAGGGSITIRSLGGVTLAANGALSASGGNDSSGGGDISIVARGDVTLNAEVDVSGSDGGILDVLSRGTVLLADIDAHGTGDAGSGGCIGAEAETQLRARGAIDATGSTGEFQTGGCGGFICLDSTFGDVTIESQATIIADGARPDGAGGLVGMAVRGDIDIQGTIDVRGPTGETCGGEVCLEAQGDINLAAISSLDVSGGDGGGDVDIIAGGSIFARGPIDASGRQRGSSGGSVNLDAGDRPSAASRVVVSNALNTGTNASCSAENGCGEAGSFELAGCEVSVESGATLDSSGPFAGEVFFIARKELKIQGTVDAESTVADNGSDGTVLIQHRDGAAVMVTGSVAPAAQLENVASCAGAIDDPPRCLAPCPNCGDGVVQFPERCDPGANTPLQCNGCSAFCELLDEADCDDGRFCTTDVCDPTLLCLNRPAIGPCSEPPTPTPTVTGTPPTETPTPSRTPTATPSSTPTATATATATPTPSQTPTASDTPTASPSPEASDTPVPSPTAEATPTSEVPPCVGDCDGGDTVTINELIIAVNIALGSRDLSACVAVDRNSDGRVAVNELIIAVGSALGGC